MIRRLFVFGLGLAVLAAVGWMLFRDPILLSVFRRVAETNVAVDRAAELREKIPGSLHVLLCGTAGPLPDPTRSGPCTAIVTDDHVLVVDAGSGVARSLGRLGVRAGGIDGVLLTHFHSDHFDGLGELFLQRWVSASRKEPLPVYGPIGVERIVGGFNEAYAQDAVYRTAHHGEGIAPSSGTGGTPRPFDSPAAGESVVVLDDRGLRVTAFAVEHDPVDPAVGYRFDYGGRSIVVSGDTAKAENLVKVAEGADVLVHDALSRELVGILGETARKAGRDGIAEIMADVPSYHASPVEVGEMARDARVGMLVFTHVVPPLPVAPLEGLFARGVAEAYGGPIVVGRDGMVFSLPEGSSAIERSAFEPLGG